MSVYQTDCPVNIWRWEDPKEGFGKHVEKGENAGYKHFLLFQVF